MRFKAWQAALLIIPSALPKRLIIFNTQGSTFGVQRVQRC
jgi:hypothetical protein